jgi:hypothetical protein
MQRVSVYLNSVRSSSGQSMRIRTSSVSPGESGRHLAGLPPLTLKRHPTGLARH